MSNSQLYIDILGMEIHLAKKVREQAVLACEALDFANQLDALEIWADDLDCQDQTWFRFEATPGECKARMRLLLFCAAGSFCRDASLGLGQFLPPEVWDQSHAPQPDESRFFGEFDSARTARFLHHNLLLAMELASGDLTPEDLPAGLVEAFQAMWAVSVDGRLARVGLPHYDLATRRSRFSRMFSTVGVLLPDHWQLFQSLWDGGVSTQKEVLAVCKLLPRL